MVDMKKYTMTPEQLEKILDAGKPTPVMFLSGGKPMFNSPQENANHAWELLGKELRFDPYSVRAIDGAPNGTFEAEPVEAP